MDEKDLVNAFYVPFASLRRAAEFAENYQKQKHNICKRNLAEVQQKRSYYLKEVKEQNWRTQYRMALRRAIFSHNWDGLAYLLKKSPIWEQEVHFDLANYVRALIILFMNHPTAKAKSLLDEYVHMVRACRSESNKRALYKGILSLTPKLFNKRHH